MGESRIELLAWLNDLLQLSYTKIEQCGTGAAACGILDSIYLDLPLGKVKFGAKHEYEYINNWKVLQEGFKRHKIDKVVPVDRLIKCKMMENLEFLQWMKRYWDLNWAGHEYDALGRRRGAAAEPNPLISGVGASHAPPTRAAVSAPAARTTSTTSSGGARRAPAMNTSSGSAGRSGVPNVAIDRLTAELSDMKINVEGLEKERNFYFEKVRDNEALTGDRSKCAQLRSIEILVGARLEAEPPIPDEEAAVLKEIQAVLYQTEPGFEIPDVEGEEEEEGLVDEEETFCALLS